MAVSDSAAWEYCNSAHLLIQSVSTFMLIANNTKINNLAHVSSVNISLR